ncbi:MAG: hypothetical protein HY397_02525 [Candidatus Doudnabacteria bacterium]|nr:hypothetical protein [Candidatus Doudnabacteria bacterium]
MIGLAVLLVLGGVVYFVFSASRDRVQDKSFENGGEVLNKLAGAYQDIKSFEIVGQANSLELAGFEGRIATNFTGQIILPQTLRTKSVVADVTKSESRGTETRNYTKETIVAHGKIFERGEYGGKEIEWELTEVMDNPLSKKYGVDDSVKFKKATSWLTLDYADTLTYVGKENNTYHYKVVTKKLSLGEAVNLVENNFFITVGPGTRGGGSLSQGDIWINDKFQIIKEKYLIPSYASEEDRVTYHKQEKEGLEIEVQYLNYDKSFDIKQPIDTSAIDEFYQQIEEGKDPEQAAKEYREKLFAQRPDLASQERDNRRFNDMMIQTYSMLEFYRDSNDGYPASLGELGELQYGIGKTPTAPTPADGNCSEEQNQYKYTRTGPNSFQLTFCLGSERPPLPAGFQTMTEKGIACIGEPQDKPYYCLPSNSTTP